MSNIPKIPPSEVPALFMVAATLPPDRVSALLSGLMGGMISALESSCECDTCVTIRGCAQGMPDIMAELL
jgi:hypothetical protein